MERYGSEGVRQVSHGNYLIFYRVEQDVVRVLRVMHGASDYLRLLDLD